MLSIFLAEVLNSEFAYGITDIHDMLMRVLSCDEIGGV